MRAEGVSGLVKNWQNTTANDNAFAAPVAEAFSAPLAAAA
jgi:hypothetical protein